MSHPNPSHDRESEYPDDNYKPVSKSSGGLIGKLKKELKMNPWELLGKKKKVAKKMAGKKGSSTLGKKGSRPPQDDYPSHYDWRDRDME